MRGDSLLGGLRSVLTTENVIFFLLASLAFAVAGNAVFTLLTNLFGTGNKALIGIAVVSILVMLALAWATVRVIRRLRIVPPIGKEPPQKRAGLILLVSNEPTCRKAIEWHREALKWCWLICSDEERSFTVANRLKQELTESGVTAYMELLTNVYDVVKAKERVEEIYAKLPTGCEESQVILDFTGMTSVVSVGAVLACLDERRPVQYTPAIYDKELEAIVPRDPVEVVLQRGVAALPAKGEVERQTMEGQGLETS